VVASRDGSKIPFASAQAMVKSIWADWGLRYPPAVEKLSRRARTTIASANRLSLYLPDEISSWCLLHELAHAMSSTEGGASDGHGPIFVGLYVQMLVRYLRVDRDHLISSLDEAGIAYVPDALPIFLDEALPQR
jgi:hypothetical protein